MFSAARWRLTAVFTLILAVILLVAGSVVYFSTSSLIYSRVDAELADKANSQMFLLDDDHRGGDNSGPGGGGDDEDGELPQFDPGGYFYAVIEPNGEVSESSYGFDAATLVSQDAIAEARETGHAIQDVTSDGDPQRVYVIASRDDDGKLLEIGRSIEPEQSDLAQLRNILLIVAAVSFLPITAGGYFISGRVLRPIKTSVDSQRAFIADASHELRTPVAVVRTNAELLERRIASGKIGQSEGDATAVSDILAETDRLGRMVSQMLTLAQADAGQTLIKRSDVDLDEVSAEVVRSLRAIADAKGVALSLHNGGAVWVNGDRDRLREVIVTVIDNAVKYTPSGGRVDVRVERRNRKATIVVSDTGAGIPAESLAHIFERFYRVDKARSRDEGGTGLGLAIARHIVEAHGGEIRIDSKLGTGTTVTIELRLLHHERQPGASELANEPGA
jgi:two-component system sensor histidine kinase CiaH